MKTQLGSFILIALISLSAKAGIDVQTARMTSSLYYELLEDTQVEPNYLGTKYDKTFLKMRFNVVNQPLVLKDASGTSSTPIVNRMSSFEFLMAVPLSSQFMMAADISLNSVDVPGQSSKFSLGDTRVFGKYKPKPLQNSWFDIAFIPEIYFPTGQASAFTTNSSLGTGMLIALEKNFSHIGFTLNTGYRYFSQAVYRNVDQKNQVPLALGAFIPVSQKISFNVEGSMNSYLSAGDSQRTGDAYAGIRCQFSKNNILSAGVGISNLSSSSDSTSYRYMIGLTILPFVESPATIVISHESIREIRKTEVVSTTNQCEIKTKTIEAFARPLRDNEKEGLVLPYNSSAEHKLQTLDLGQVTGVADNGTSYAKDTQTLFAFDLHNLPIRNSVVQINSAELKLNVSKLSNGTSNSIGSEVLCFIGPSICSGELMSGSWLKNINRAFFRGKETPNDYFARQSIENKVSQVGDQTLYSGELSLSVKKLLENSEISDTMELLYDKALPTQKVKNKTLYMSIGNQTYLSSDAKLILNLSIDTCANQSAKQIKKIISTSQEEVIIDKPKRHVKKHKEDK